MTAQTRPEEVLHAGLPPANDRMLTTIFVAALLHGIIILGVTFSSSRGKPDDAAPGLEVVLVSERAPSAARNANAKYLAQRTQLGAGNMDANGRTRIPKSSLMPIDRLGVPGGEGAGALRSGTERGDDALLASVGVSPRILYFAANTSAEQHSELPLLLEKRPDLAMAPNDDGVELHMRGAAKQGLWIAADTRESDVAVYLDGWRRKVERLGTLNFPAAARSGQMTGTPVIEVTIGADGRLLQTALKRSSGHDALDAAAMRILKLAAPYDRFSRELAAKHDEIRIAYEWQFLGGASQGGSVFAPDQP